ncbi:MAG: hypothetical protein ABIJ91_00540 [Candidatus Kuenenbacteria bacterium]
MKKFKPVILISIISAIVCSAVSFWVGGVDWPFLPYLLLAGCFIILIQKETVAYKFLDKLLVGSLLFGFLTMTLVFLRMFAMSHLVYDSPLPFSFWWDGDMFIMAAVFVFVSFLGGLLGIVLKGFHTLYKNKLDKVIVFTGPLLVLFSTLSIYKIKIGGTIMSSLHGWPYPFMIHQIKDVLDNFAIDKWIFSPGSLYHYIIFNYLLYLLIFILAYYLIKFINTKLATKKINSTVFLFGLFVLLIIVFTSFLPAKKSYISHQISGSGYCEENSDCVIIRNKCPFSCAVVVNKNNANRITDLINSFPSTCELNCFGREKAACLENKCWISISHTSNQTYWEIIKQAVNNCEVSSIMQTHSLEVTAVLKSGVIIKVIEPEIDDIFDIVKQTENKCGEIIIGTE